MHFTCPSRTALRVAQRRAAHQVLDHPRVFDDPLALRILDLERDPAARPLLEAADPTPYARGLRAFLAVRSRFAEEVLRQAVDLGVAQYVVLGAGLDTFGCRNPYPGLRVFEVDRPEMQAWKRARLSGAGIPAPASLRFAPVDLATQDLMEELPRAGFDPAAPALFAWLGVAQYLPAAEVLATLRAVACLPEDSAVVFDYALAPHLIEPRLRGVYDALAARVASAGEPFRSGFDPAALRADLAGMGFTSVTDLGPDELTARYFADRDDGLGIRGFTRLVHAVV